MWQPRSRNLTSFPVPHDYHTHTLIVLVVKMCHDSGASYSYLAKKHHTGSGREFPCDDIGSGTGMRRTIPKIKQEYTNGSMSGHLSSLRTKRNTSHAPLPPFNNSDNVLRQIRDATQDPTREGWNTPVLNRFLTPDRRNMKESQGFTLAGSGNKKAIPGILCSAPAPRTSDGGQSMGTLHQTCRVGPPVCIFFT